MTAVLTPTGIAPADVRDVLARSILADGLDFVLDIDRSSQRRPRSAQSHARADFEARV